MNVKYSIVWICVLASLLAAGCATTKKIDWAARTGHYYYDQAVVELGPPDKSAKLQDGTVVADWITRHGYAQTWSNFDYPYHRHGPFFYPAYADTYTTYMPDYWLRLTFGADGKLQAWKKFTR